jgi:hypothetical protein
MDLLVGDDFQDPRVGEDLVELVVEDDGGETVEDMVVDLSRLYAG